MQITRRTALLGTAALAAIAPLPALAYEQDAELFLAIGRWRVARDACEAYSARLDAIHKACEATMPEYVESGRRTRDAIEQVSRGGADRAIVQEAIEAGAEIDRAFQARLGAAGYDEDAFIPFCGAMTDAYVEAMRIPARTLVGLKAKSAMANIEEPDGPYIAAKADGWGLARGPGLAWGTLLDDIEAL